MKGIICAPQPEAVEAGLDVLASGGNAVDAAVACAFTQTAVDPLMCGVAGFGAMTLRLADGRAEVINFHGRAPRAVRPDMWAHLIRGEAEDGFGFLLEGQVNEVGYQSITTPETLAALALAAERHGTRPLADLMAPAIAYAEDGFALRPHVVNFIREGSRAGRVAHPEYVTRCAATREIYCPHGRLPELGERHRNPDMARTLRRIAEGGPDVFYRGEVARAIDADVRAHGGHLSLADLAAVEPVVTPPVTATYRGHEVLTNPLPGGGVMLVLMLNILENFDLAAMGHNSPRMLATLAEAMKVATIEKDARMGDPAFVDVPVEELTSKAHAAAAAERIAAGEKAHVPRLGLPPEPRDTTHVSVVDGAGDVVSLTHSIGMPSGVVTRGLGIMYNGCMGVFDPRPGRAGSLAPGKRRFTASCPTILLRGGEPVFVVGAPGGTTITMGVLQAIVNFVDFGMGALEAVVAPRVLALSDTVELSNRILRRSEAALAAMGYPTRRSPRSHEFPAVHALSRGPEGWTGGADPMTDGMAARAD